MREKLEEWNKALVAAVLSLMGMFGLEGVTERKALKMAGDNRGQLGFSTVIAAATVVVAVMVVIIIVDRFDTALGTPDNGELGNASDSVISGFASMADLIGPLLIVAIAVVIISLIRRVQST
jgi:hypothetical protein